VIALVVLAGAVVAGWFALLEYPSDLTELFGVVLLVGLAVGAVRAGGRLANTVLPSYNVAEVSVEGPITRDGGSSGVRSPVGAAAEDIVEEIERADEDRAVEALVLELNTPGGEIVPSEDIRLAAEDFDGPTVAYATDVCASGGYEIASGCDQLWAREGSLVGSIGVIGSRVTAADLADRLGLSYEQFTAGEFKDAGTPLKEMAPDEREYLQGLVDDYYEQFVADVADGRDLDAERIRDTEAKVYLGEEARERGLVDELGTRTAVVEHLEEEFGASVSVREFEPSRPLSERLRSGARAVAFSLGAGVASTFDGGVDGLSFRL
jgi:protease-4